MIAALTDNPAALGEAFTVSTAEHNTWREVAELYGRLIGLTYEVVPAEAYLGFLGCDLLSAQLYYDRCFDRPRPPPWIGTQETTEERICKKVWQNVLCPRRSS